MKVLATHTLVGIVGAGSMGAGIAQVAAAAGHTVLLFDVAPNAAETAIAKIGNTLAKRVANNKMNTLQVENILARLQACTQISELADAGLVIEAIVEDLSIKQNLFKQLEGICGNGTILATNTSSLSITAIAAKLDRPDNFLGMHFFNPAPAMKLVEVISGLATKPAIAECIFNTANNWNKKAVHARSTPGFIVNRVARPFYGEALRILQEGSTDSSTIDALMRDSGQFRMGPFQLMDLIGHDINYAVTCSVFNAFYQDPRFTPSLIQQELLNAGRLGQKSGKGFYDYTDPSNRITASTASLQPSPRKVQQLGNLGLATPLLDIAKLLGLQITPNTSLTINHAISGGLWVDGALLMQTDGRSATEVSATLGFDDVVLYDLALNYKTTSRLALCKSDQCSDAGLNRAIGFVQALDKQVSVIDDIPGMVVMRTVCMLANEGADAVHQNVCSAAAVDTAMKSGLNYPHGPLQWAQDIGIANTVTVLNHLANHYGEDRYRVSPLLKRLQFSKQSFY